MKTIKTLYKKLISFALCAISILQCCAPVSAKATSTYKLYAGPSEKSAVICEFNDGDSVTLLETISADWSKVKLKNGSTGFCDSSVVNAVRRDEEAKTMFVTAIPVVLYSSPDTDSAIIGTLPAKTLLDVTAQLDDGFVMIQLHGGGFAYVKAKSLEAFTQRTANIAAIPKLSALTDVATEEEAAQRLEELSDFFVDGAYWNDYDFTADSSDKLRAACSISDTPCAHSNRGYGHCNVYTGAISKKAGYGYGTQCLGYAALLSDLVFGTDAPVYVHGDFDSIRVGDHVRLVLWDHSMLVTDVCKDENGKTYIYVTDVNADYETCQIEWHRKFTQADLRRLGDYVRVYTRYPEDSDE